MKTALLLVAGALSLMPHGATAENVAHGRYLEVRTCDVYTGPCFANGEMGLTGREAILVWSVTEGAWDGVDISGLNVIAALESRDTLGDVAGKKVESEASIIVDERATAGQRAALEAMVREKAGHVVGSVKKVESAPIATKLATCDKSGCAEVKAADLVDISTRCMGGDDHVCGNESTFYPPLTELRAAYPVFTKVAAYRGDALGLTWAATEQRGAFLGAFEY
ncbi:MAG: hypothetical protein RLZZ303_215 [Candidatus Hydrogenedentota bacterium]|jgi:hypothetical protein